MRFTSPPGLELLEESNVVLEEQADLGNAVPEHRDALETHAEREAGDELGIEADGAEHVRVHHAGAEHLEPSRALAHAAAPGRVAFGDPSLSPADHAGDVHLAAGLDEREIDGD